MSEEITSKACFLQENLKGNFKSESINISYKLKSIIGRFNFPKISYQSQTEILNLEIRNSSSIKFNDERESLNF
jgi:hypothetical protein